jgi:ribulose-phosphate 3-epimerase
MSVVCPAILAADPQQYREQIERVAGFAHRIQIDLTDGVFAKNKTVTPEEAWWPVGINPDFHLMYQRPDAAIHTILEHQPHMIIVHSEADGSFEFFASLCHRKGVKIGVALLQQTSVESVLSALDKIDHILIFSGSLGSYGGHANLDLLSKIDVIKHYKPNLEIGWDGGINDQNISTLASAGIDVFNVGGFIQSSPDPEHAYNVLQRIADETGTT